MVISNGCPGHGDAETFDEMVLVSLMLLPLLLVLVLVLAESSLPVPLRKSRSKSGLRFPPSIRATPTRQCGLRHAGALVLGLLLVLANTGADFEMGAVYVFFCNCGECTSRDGKKTLICGWPCYGAHMGASFSAQASQRRSSMKCCTVAHDMPRACG